MSNQTELEVFATHVGTTLAGIGSGYKIVAVNVLTTSGTLDVAGTPTHLLNAATTHLTGWVFAGGASGRSGSAARGYYDPEVGQSYAGTATGGPGGGGGQQEPIPIFPVSALTLPLSYIVGAGGAAPAAPTSTTDGSVAGGSANVGSPSSFGPAYAAGGAVDPNNNSIQALPGYLTDAALLRTVPRALLVTAVTPGKGGVPGSSTATAAGPAAFNLSAAGGGVGASTTVAGRVGGYSGNLQPSALPTNSTTTSVPTTPVSVDGIAVAGIGGVGGTGGGVASGAGVRTGGNGGDGGFPGGGGGGGGGGANFGGGSNAIGGRGGKGGDGCIVLFELEQQ